MAGFVGLMLCTTASAAVIDVPAEAEIFSAGQAGPLYDGILPSLYSFTPDSIVSITFTSVTGTVSCGNACASDIAADGTTISGFTGTNLACTTCGISGIRFDGRQMFLVGVFLDENSTPSGANPSNFQNYTNTSADADAFSPGLNQVFFIGDGQGTNGTQTFFAPTGAGRLYFGFADGVPSFGSPSQVASGGAYSDNSGALQLTFEAQTSEVPEPGTITLFAFGLAALVFGRKKQII
jgi:hypothetical protein